MATWISYANKKQWEIAGASGSLDREPQEGGTVTLAATGYQTLYLSPTLAQSWLSIPASNNEIIIANATNTDGVDSYSREPTTSGLRPQLNATYTAP